MRLLALFLALLFVMPAAVAIYPGDPGFRGCVMLLPDGQFQDSDCDDVPDIADNCPLAPNHAQSDVDRNGLGDLCDLVIDEITIEPEEPMQGRSVLVKVGLFNNRPYPMRNMVVKVEIPKLGQVSSEQLPVVRPGERIVEEVLLRIPECAPSTLTDFVAIVEYPFAPSEKEIFSRAVRVPVTMSGTCPHDPGNELTIVDITELQDVHPENGAVYPFTIKNNWPDSRAYVLTVQGHESWGSVSIEPSSVIVVPPGGTREGVLHVFGYEGQTGDRSFSLTVQARDDAKQVILRASLPEESRTTPQWPGSQLLIGILVFLGILGLIALVIGFMKSKHDETMEERLKDLYHLDKGKGKSEKKSSGKKKSSKKKKSSTSRKSKKSD